MTVSPEYRRILEIEHESSSWGDWRGDSFKHVMPYLKGVRTILDYGAGAGYLKIQVTRTIPASIRPTVIEYDPGIPRIATPPEPAEFVVCFDVLEHVEPDHLEAVLDDLVRVTTDKGLFQICCFPAHRTLSDGRNAHLIIESQGWWLTQIERKFKVLRGTITGKFLVVYVTKQ